LSNIKKLKPIFISVKKHSHYNYFVKIQDDQTLVSASKGIKYCPGRTVIFHFK